MDAETASNGRPRLRRVPLSRRKPIMAPEPARHSPGWCALAGVAAGFVVGAAIAISLSGWQFSTRVPPDWLNHLIAGGLGLSVGLAGTILLPGRWVKVASAIAPAVGSTFGSVATFTAAGPSGPETIVWFGTSAALAGAAIGLLAGFASHRLLGFVGGIVAGQIAAWLSAVVYLAMQKSGVPFGLAFVLPYMFVGALTHAAIAIAMRLLKVYEPKAVEVRAQNARQE